MAVSLMACQLSNSDLNRLFPAYLQVDRQGLIRNVGPSLAKHAKDALPGKSILEMFEIERPLIRGGLTDLLKDGGNCVLSLRSNASVRLQGTVQETEGTFFLFLGYVANMDRGDDQLPLTFADFAAFDASKDLIVAAQIRKGLLSDVEDLVRQLKAEKAAAEAANRSKSEFLACMSHEIRTPLNGVLGLAALLERTKLNDAQAQMLQSLRVCGTTLLDLLNDIIDISRMDAERFEIVDEQIRIGELVDRISDQYSIIADGKNLDLNIEIDAQLAQTVVVCDPTRLFQIIGNLVSNAIKFTEVGQVRLEVFEVSASANGTVSANIRVSDTGIGIAPENLERIFDSFSQADTGITRNFGGTGLGLTICRRLCEMMGGSIQVDSKLGEGSVFHVELPLRRIPQRMAS